MTGGQSIVADLRRALGDELAARRVERKLTQAQLAERLHVHRTTITHLEAGNHGASLDFWALVDDVLVASGVLVDAHRAVQTAMAAHQRHKADATVERYRSAAAQHWSEGRILPDASHTQSDLAMLLDNAISESVDLTAATEATSLGSVGMEQLQADVKSLASSRLCTSAPCAVSTTILARRRIFRFLHGKHSPLQEIQLYFLAGQLSGLLSHACKDLGRYDSAATHARTAQACGAYIKHDGLGAWACGLQAISAFWSGRPDRAIKLADSGLKYAEIGTTASWLHGIRARAFGHLRSTGSLRDALRRAWAVRDGRVENDLCDLLGGPSGFGVEKLHYYSANALAWTGDADGVISEGSRALELYGTADPARRSTTAEATVRIDMSIILFRKRQFGEAIATLRPVLSIALEHRNAGLRQQLRRVRRELAELHLRSLLGREVAAEIDAFLAARPPTISPTAAVGSEAW